MKPIHLPVCTDSSIVNWWNPTGILCTFGTPASIIYHLSRRSVLGHFGFTSSSTRPLTAAHTYIHSTIAAASPPAANGMEMANGRLLCIVHGYFFGRTESNPRTVDSDDSMINQCAAAVAARSCNASNNREPCRVVKGRRRPWYIVLVLEQFGCCCCGS